MRSNPSGIIVLKKYTNSVQKTYREAEYMFQFNAELIQAEFGENAAEAYTPKDNRSWIDKLGSASPPVWTDQLIHLTAQLREKLSQAWPSPPSGSPLNQGSHRTNSAFPWAWEGEIITIRKSISLMHWRKWYWIIMFPIWTPQPSRQCPRPVFSSS